MFGFALSNVLVIAPEYVGPLPRLFDEVVHGVGFPMFESTHSETDGLVAVEVGVIVLGL